MVKVVVLFDIITEDYWFFSTKACCILPYPFGSCITWLEDSSDSYQISIGSMVTAMIKLATLSDGVKVSDFFIFTGVTDWGDDVIEHLKRRILKGIVDVCMSTEVWDCLIFTNVFIFYLRNSVCNRRN